ncbi:MAG TPA: GNAT family N-acetyltransferase [Kofleriaceae bacterium]|nr:GNAT family N-acetyltransferase [Kofleriaceae bacterium]
MEHRRGELVISTDPERLDLDMVHGYLAGESYWARGVPRERLERAIRHSLCFGLYDGDRQIGFARIVTDRATFAYLCDVFLLEPHRGRGLGTWMMESISAHPDLTGLRRWLLATRDAHPFYRQLGWSAPDNPDAYMEIVKPYGADRPRGADQPRVLPSK